MGPSDTVVDEWALQGQESGDTGLWPQMVKDKVPTSHWRDQRTPPSGDQFPVTPTGVMTPIKNA